MLENTLKTRLLGWAIVALLLQIVLAVLAPQQLPVLLYKVALVTQGAVLAYWIDRALFPYARPHVLLRRVDDCYYPAALAMLRRALIVLACVLGLTLGL